MANEVEQMNLLQDFLFQEVISNPKYGNKVAKLILEVILQRPIGDVLIQTQKVRTPGNTTGHGIRMDAYIEETAVDSEAKDIWQKKMIYDVEPHCYDVTGLPKQSRYYQAIIDSSLLRTAEDYKVLKPLWVIIITSKDIFGEDRMCYSFEHRCKENLELALGDEATRIFLYTKGKIGARTDLAELLQYMENSQVENVHTETTRQIHEVVEKVRHSDEVGVRYLKALQYENYIREKAREEGLSKGLAEGDKKFISLICKKLKKEFGAEEIADMLEEGIEKVKRICDIARQYAPEYNVEDIYMALHGEKKQT